MLINYGTALASVRVPDLPAGQALRSAYPAGGALSARIGKDGSATIHLAPLSVRVFDVGSTQGAQATPPGNKGAKKKGAKKASKAGAKVPKAAQPTKGAKSAKGPAPTR